MGTLLSAFLATSDEAILILLGHPDRGGDILWLIAVKLIIGIVAGYAVDLFLKRWITVPKKVSELCDDCGCEESGGILKPAIHHTIKITVYLFVFTLLLNGFIEFFGVSKLSAVLLGNTIFQPVIAAVIGLIPNCAASVILSQLYLSGAISFASVVAGLCTGAGLGLVVLFRVNRHRGENLKIMGCLIGIGIAAGIILELLPL